jgi:RNA polymerase sigma factor (sigma-70 family)
MIPRVRAIVRRDFPVPDHIAGQDDLVQIGMLGVLKASTRWAPDRGTTFSTFALIYAIGAIRDHLRKQALGGRTHHAEFHVQSLDAPVQGTDSVTFGDTIPVHDDAGDPFILDAIEMAVRGLSLDAQSAFRLVFEDDLTEVEAGRLMGVSESRVCQWIGDARRAIAAQPAVREMAMAA